jgi:hypothetical protein
LIITSFSLFLLPGLLFFLSLLFVALLLLLLVIALTPTCAFCVSGPAVVCGVRDCLCVRLLVTRQAAPAAVPEGNCRRRRAAGQQGRLSVVMAAQHEALRAEACAALHDATAAGGLLVTLPARTCSLIRQAALVFPGIDFQPSVGQTQKKRKEKRREKRVKGERDGIKGRGRGRKTGEREERKGARENILERFWICCEANVSMRPAFSAAEATEEHCFHSAVSLMSCPPLPPQLISPIFFSFFFSFFSFFFPLTGRRAGAAGDGAAAAQLPAR